MELKKHNIVYNLMIDHEVVNNVYIDIKHMLMNQGKDLKNIKNVKAKITHVKFIDNELIPVDHEMYELANDDVIYLEKYFNVNCVPIGVCLTTEYEFFAFEIYRNNKVKYVTVEVEIEYE